MKLRPEELMNLACEGTVCKKAQRWKKAVLNYLSNL